MTRSKSDKPLEEWKCVLFQCPFGSAGLDVYMPYPVVLSFFVPDQLAKKKGNSTKYEQFSFVQSWNCIELFVKLLNLAVLIYKLVLSTFA